MYSPKIDERYIPILYRMAKKQNIHMTVLVNQIIEEVIEANKPKSLTQEVSHVKTKNCPEEEGGQNSCRQEPRQRRMGWQQDSSAIR